MHPDAELIAASRPAIDKGSPRYETEAPDELVRAFVVLGPVEGARAVFSGR